MADKLHIVFASSEMVPYMKTGGLADVSGALPKALVRLGHRVTAFLPRYGTIPFPPGEFVGSVHVPVDAVNRSAGFYRTMRPDGVEVIFVEHPDFFDRLSPNPYGFDGHDYADNRLRFAFFARSVVEFYRSRGERPSVFHIHDWQTGLLPVYLKAFYSDDPTLARAPVVFTIHNLAYQGNFGADTLSILGLPWNLGTREGIEFHGQHSYMKAGILFSEIVNTVSPTYAREIQTPEMGYRMDGVVRARGADLSGILNGVDYDEWDPGVDTHIAARFSARDASGKAECKADLLRTLGLPEFPDLPVIGVTSRLIWLKGFDIVAQAWYDFLRRPLRMVILGTGEPEILAGLQSLADHAPDRFAVRFSYDTGLAHKIIAGSDIFLMPSRFEPCGLTQLYSLRYGTVPVARSAGGLVDTVEQWNAATGEGTGFRFDAADGTGIMWAIDQALAAYRDKKAWRKLMKNGMSRDFSWDRSARAYVDLYERAIAKA